jgi:hypothetical protein
MRHLKGLVVLVVGLGLLLPLYAQPPGASEDERKLMKEKLETAKKELDEVMAMSRQVRFDILSGLPAQQRFIDAGLDYYQESADRVKLLDGLATFAKSVEKFVEGRFEAGAGRPIDLYAVHYARLDAEVRLLREKKRAQPAGLSEEERKSRQEKTKGTLETARKELEEGIAQSQQVRFEVWPVLSAQQHFVDAGLDYYQESADRVKLLKDLVRLAKEADAIFEGRFKGGAGTQVEMCAARYARLDAELRLLREKKAQPAAPSDEDRKLMQEKMKDKLETARKEVDQVMSLLKDVKFGPSPVVPAYKHFVDAGLDFYVDVSDRVKLLEDALKFAKGAEEIVQSRLKGGTGMARDLSAVRYVRIDAELRLLREKKKAK